MASRAAGILPNIRDAFISTGLSLEPGRFA
jgi:hypothetical protein